MEEQMSGARRELLLENVAAEYADGQVRQFAALTAKGRKQMPSSAFALPNKRMFPIHDAEHARKALQLLGRALAAGSITAQEAAIVRRKATAKLKKP